MLKFIFLSIKSKSCLSRPFYRYVSPSKRIVSSIRQKTNGPFGIIPDKERLLRESLVFSKSYILGFITRYVPRFRSTKPKYLSLLKSPEIVNYFKRFNPFRRLTEIESYMVKSPYYDPAHIQKVSDQVDRSKELFLEGVSNAVSIMSKDFIPKISEAEHRYGVLSVLKRVFNFHSTNFRPSSDFVMNQINFKASSGLPQPWLSKRMIKTKILSIIQRLPDHNLDLHDLDTNPFELVPLNAAFVRFQITNSGLKARLVFAVCYYFIAIETYFNTILKYIIDRCNSCAIHGYAQPRISKLITKQRNRHTLCIDYSKFDLRMPSFVIATCAHISVLVMRLNPHFRKLFLDTIAWFISSPVFHPEIPFSERRRGIPSGSGYTSLFGSMCNMYMLSIALRRYCYMNRVVLRDSMFDIFVSSDDTVISTSFYVNSLKFAQILKEAFDHEVTIESESKPGEDRAFFLGSEWIDGKPFRNINRLLCRIIFGSGDYPKMSKLAYFQSRCFEILGNVYNYHDIYKTFRVPYPTRVFRLFELMDYTSRTRLVHNKGIERRGKWVDTTVSRSSAMNVWETR